MSPPIFSHIIFISSRVVELTGDVTPDMRAIAQADLIVTTPEKWDGVSRSWQNRSYVQKVAILIIDEIHLLGKGCTHTHTQMYLQYNVCIVMLWNLCIEIIVHSQNNKKMSSFIHFYTLMRRVLIQHPPHLMKEVLLLVFV